MIRSGLVGRSILASRSPFLHESEAAAQGLELTYELFDFTARGLPDSALGDVLHDLRDKGFAGFNVTYPFKQAVPSLLDELAETAAAVGAVNTVAIRDGRLIGHNTDMAGFRDSVRTGLPGASLDHVVQVGAGGAGSAVASALLSLGTGLLEICDINTARAEALAAGLARHFGAGRVRASSVARIDFAGVDGIVNTTPIGMTATPGTPIDPDLITPRHWVADVIYFPLETELLRVAREKGCATMNGTGMVVGQAALAFEIITGHRADVERMKLAFA